MWYAPFRLRTPFVVLQYRFCQQYFRASCVHGLCACVRLCVRLCVAGAYKYVSELWKKKQSDVMRFLLRVRCWEYRQLPSIIRVSRPTRPDKARRLGYKAKQVRARRLPRHCRLNPAATRCLTSFVGAVMLNCGPEPRSFVLRHSVRLISLCRDMLLSLPF
ncbi:unnamed protein product [Closterium sp. NIES-54]